MKKKKKKRRKDLIISTPKRFEFINKLKLSIKKFFNLRNILLYVFILALVLRIIYIINNDYPPIDSEKFRNLDSYYYHLNGIYAKRIITNFIPFTVNAFTGQYTKKELAYYGFIDNPFQSILRAPLYGFFIGFIYLFFPPSQLIVALFQSLLSAFICIIVYEIGKIIVDKKTGLIAAILNAVWFPLIKSASEFFTETFTAFMIVLYIYILLKTLNQRTPKNLFILGVASTLLTLSNQPMQYAVYIILIFIILLLKYKYQEKVIKSCKYFIFGLLITSLPWFYLVKQTTGKYQYGVTTGLGRLINRGVSEKNNGWNVSYANQLGKTFRKVFFSPENRYLNFWERFDKAALEETKYIILTHPIKTGINLIKKWFRYWNFTYTRPYIPNKKFEFLNNLIFLWIHRLLVILALLGIFFIIKEWSYIVALLIIPFYTVGVFSFFVFEPRHLILVTPIILLFSSIGLYYIIKILFTKKLRENLFRFPYNRYFAIIIVFTLVVIKFVNVENILKLFDNKFNPYIGYGIVILLYNIMLLSVTFIFSFVLKVVIEDKKMMKLSIILFYVLLLFYYNLNALTNPRWGEWSIKLKNNKQTIIQEIHIPYNIDYKNYSKALIAIDLKSSFSKKYDLNIYLNDILIKRYANGIYLENVKIYGTAENYAAKYPEQRQWFFIPVEISLLKNNYYIKIKLTFTNKNGTGNYVRVYGDYRLMNGRFNNEKKFILPSFFDVIGWYDDLTQDIRKYFDNRPMQEFRLYSNYRKSYYIIEKDKKSILKSLKGGFRIFILFREKGEYYLTPDGKIVWLDSAPEGYKKLYGTYNFNFIRFQRDIYKTGYIIF